MIIQLDVPSASGTNAGFSASGEPAQQNLRASTCTRKLFSWNKKNFATRKAPASIIEMRAATLGCVGQEKNQGKRPRTSIASVTRLTAST